MKHSDMEKLVRAGVTSAISLKNGGRPVSCLACGGYWNWEVTPGHVYHECGADQVRRLPWR